ncbi:Rho guanine nucleotide exchange factor [Marasmius crinis-equi]|uniref:Rho guanine nucleotide exchange factor n=1 Tax=Marasmius crinis-equi TaxID=585013 RepID=A0ABR3FTV1_9AGAR
MQNVEKLGKRPIGTGGFADVWKGKVGEKIVCLKVLRLFTASDVERARKDFMQEAIVWRQLNHPNLLPFMGIYYLDDELTELSLISPWMERGNLVQFMKDYPELVDRNSLARDVACGLSHLHDMKIVHGDLKGVNVLITPELAACIGDFGISYVTDTQRFFSSQIEHSKGTTRWLSPELLMPGPNCVVSKESDVYAYGCVCYEGGETSGRSSNWDDPHFTQIWDDSENSTLVPVPDTNLFDLTASARTARENAGSEKTAPLWQRGGGESSREWHPLPMSMPLPPSIFRNKLDNLPIVEESSGEESSGEANDRAQWRPDPALVPSTEYIPSSPGLSRPRSPRSPTPPEADWKHAPGQPRGAPVISPLILAGLPDPRPAWTQMYPRTGRIRIKGVAAAPAAPPPQTDPRTQTHSWARWHFDPMFVPTPPSVEHTTLLVPESSSPGLFGPRSPRRSIGSEADQ